MPQADSVRPIRWRGDHLELLDQRRLPHEVEVLKCQDASEVAAAITAMVVRGAPAIGMSAAYGVVLEAQRLGLGKGGTMSPQMQEALSLLGQSRPTAVNLRWALERMGTCLQDGGGVEELLSLAHGMMEKDLEANRTMGNLGAALMEPGTGVYTHCNTGSLATAGYGTALGVVRSAFAQDRLRDVFAGETRPWLQGARLTSWELHQDGIPVKLVVEGAAGSLFARGAIDWVVVGADRITACGDTANKIGTYNLAVLAKHHGARFMVVAHSSTIDLQLKDGADIPIEERPEDEVTHLAGRAVAPEGVQAHNPAFDVTPHHLIDAIVTERGVIHGPDESKMAAVIGDAV